MLEVRDADEVVDAVDEVVEELVTVVVAVGAGG